MGKSPPDQAVALGGPDPLQVGVRIRGVKNLPSADALSGRRQPLYQQMVQSLREQIRSGELAPGSQAPSESELIARFQVSSTTARRALNELAQEGLVRRVQGRGSFITELAGVQRLRHVGVLYHDLIELTGTFSAQALRGINRALADGGGEAVLLQFGQVRRNASPAAALAALAAHYRLDAILLLSPTPAAWLTEVLATGLPVAAVNFAYDELKVLSVTADHRRAMERLIERFRALGHERVAMLRGNFDPELVAGVHLSHPQEADFASGLLGSVDRYDYFDEGQLRACVARRLAHAQRPTAFLGWGYEAALAAMAEIRQHGWRVPEDVSVAFVGVPPGPTQIAGEILPIEAMSAAAVERLLAAIAGQPAEASSHFSLLSHEGATLGLAHKKP